MCITKSGNNSKVREQQNNRWSNQSSIQWIRFCHLGLTLTFLGFRAILFFLPNCPQELSPQEYTCKSTKLNCKYVTIIITPGLQGIAPLDFQKP